MKEVAETIRRFGVEAVFLKPWKAQQGTLVFECREPGKAEILHGLVSDKLVKAGAAHHLRAGLGYSSAGFRAGGSVKTSVSIKPATPRGAELIEQLVEELKKQKHAVKEL